MSLTRSQNASAYRQRQPKKKSTYQIGHLFKSLNPSQTPHLTFRLLNFCCTSRMSFLFHSPVHALFPVIQTWEEGLGWHGSEKLCACLRGSGFTHGGAPRGARVAEDGVRVVGKTISGGTFSPNVRASFAMRLRRTSIPDGLGGRSTQTGVMGSTRLVSGV